MRNETRRVYFLALLLGAVFLAAQLHCCVDLNSTGMDSHLCPICSTAGSAIATPSLVMVMVPAINRLEVIVSVHLVSAEFARAAFPRAPPSF